MGMIVKAGAGLVAGVVAGALGLAFFPQMERSALTPRAAVEKPQFVATAPAAKTAAPVVQATTAAPVPAAATPAAVVASPVKLSPSPVALTALTPPAKPTPTAAPAASPKAPPALAKAPAAPVIAPAAPTIAPAPVAASAEATPDAGSAPWSVRGLVALARGDLSSARVYLIRAAEAGDPRAFVALADTYDPAMLIKLGVIVAPGDAQRARDYLAKAAAAGVVAAKDRIAALEQNAH